jgi:hypothetical protein
MDHEKSLERLTDAHNFYDIFPNLRNQIKKQSSSKFGKVLRQIKSIPKEELNLVLLEQMKKLIHLYQKVHFHQTIHSYQKVTEILLQCTKKKTTKQFE